MSEEVTFEDLLKGLENLHDSVLKEKAFVVMSSGDEGPVERGIKRLGYTDSGGARDHNTIMIQLEDPVNISSKDLKQWWIFSKNGYSDCILPHQPQHTEAHQFIHVVPYSYYRGIESELKEVRFLLGNKVLKEVIRPYSEQKESELLAVYRNNSDLKELLKSSENREKSVFLLAEQRLEEINNLSEENKALHNQLQMQQPQTFQPTAEQTEWAKGLIETFLSGNLVKQAEDSRKNLDEALKELDGCREKIKECDKVKYSRDRWHNFAGSLVTLLPNESMTREKATTAYTALLKEDNADVQV